MEILPWWLELDFIVYTCSIKNGENSQELIPDIEEYLPVAHKTCKESNIMH